MITKISALICVVGFAVPGIAQAQSSSAAAKDERNMTIKDIGPKPQSFDLENATRANTNFRTTAWTGRYLRMATSSCGSTAAAAACRWASLRTGSHSTRKYPMAGAF